MCHSHSEQTEITQEYLDSLAALAHYKMPSEEELTASRMAGRSKKGKLPRPTAPSFIVTRPGEG